MGVLVGEMLARVGIIETSASRLFHAGLDEAPTQGLLFLVPAQQPCMQKIERWGRMSWCLMLSGIEESRVEGVAEKSKMTLFHVHLLSNGPVTQSFAPCVMRATMVTSSDAMVL